MKSISSKRFLSSDIWIFLSLSKDEGGTSLESLIAKADWINHAIPLAEEIEGAVNRLSTAGLVQFEGETIFLTEAGRMLFENFHDRRGAMLNIWKKLEKHLNSTEFPQLAVTEFKLDPAQLAQAVQNYLKR